MNNWDLKTYEVAAHQPEIVSTSDDARVLLIALPSGERLQEHEVHERAFVLVVAGEVEISTAAGEGVAASAGHLFEFDPGERHEVEARSDARLALFLTPWPGAGHPGTMTIEEKASARERAREHPSG